MNEDPAEIAELQQLLDSSLAGASEHLQSIIRPDRAVPAADLVRRLTGMRTLALATVSAGGRPRVSGVDGHLLRGRWVFTTSGSSVKAADMRSRPHVSAAYLEGDSFGVFTHGTAEFLTADHDGPALDRGAPDQALRLLAVELGPGHRLRQDPAELDGRLRGLVRRVADCADGGSAGVTPRAPPGGPDSRISGVSATRPVDVGLQEDQLRDRDRCADPALGGVDAGRDARRRVVVHARRSSPRRAACPARCAACAGGSRGPLPGRPRWPPRSPPRRRCWPTPRSAGSSSRSPARRRRCRAAVRSPPSRRRPRCRRE